MIINALHTCDDLRFFKNQNNMFDFLVERYADIGNIDDYTWYEYDTCGQTKIVTGFELDNLVAEYREEAEAEARHNRSLRR